MTRFLFLGIFLTTTLLGPYWVSATGEIPPPNLPLFYQEAGRAVTRSLKRRSGVVLWIDREAGTRQVFGDSALLSRAFLPGSLLKLVTAEAALALQPNWHYRCMGRDKINGRVRHCWTYRGHGDLDLARALGISCNLFFSWVGSRLGYEPLRAALLGYGFAAAADLPTKTGDSALNPADLAIGDAPAFRVTPEEMARFWDRYLNHLQDPKYAAILQGLRRAVSEGTARRLGALDLEILGKTGTGDARLKTYKTNGWFLGAYPVEHPRWLLVVFLEEAHGFDEAVGLAEQIFSLAKHLEVLR